MAAREHRTAAVVGGGPAGLLSAITRGAAGPLTSSSAAPRRRRRATRWGGQRSYQLGLNAAPEALRRFGVMDRVDARAASVRGRLSIGADGNPRRRLTPPASPGARSRDADAAMQRDRLQACLLEAVGDYERVAVHFGVACDGVGFGDRPTLAPPPRSDLGPWSALTAQPRSRGARGRAGLDDEVRALREQERAALPDDPAASVPVPHADDLNWGFRNGPRPGMDALPTLEGEMVAVLLFKPDSPVSRRLAALETADDALFRRRRLQGSKESEIPNFKGSYLGRCPLVSADF
ncbi:FAD binding protein [Aureococcus anophagefferens]|nr:FAD binding protein [Aureococcus anophagefferens]